MSEMDAYLVVGYRACSWCAADVRIECRPGRPRLYCNHACRQRAYEHRHGFSHERTPRMLPGQADDRRRPLRATDATGYERGGYAYVRGKTHALRTSVRPEGQRRETLCGLLEPPAGRPFSLRDRHACASCSSIADRHPLRHPVEPSNELARLRAIIDEIGDDRHERAPPCAGCAPTHRPTRGSLAWPGDPDRARHVPPRLPGQLRLAGHGRGRRGRAAARQPGAPVLLRRAVPEGQPLPRPGAQPRPHPAPAARAPGARARGGSSEPRGTRRSTRSPPDCTRSLDPRAEPSCRTATPATRALLAMFFPRAPSLEPPRRVAAAAGVVRSDGRGRDARPRTGPAETLDPSELRHSQLILLWGTNTRLTNRHLWPVIEAARADGATVVVIDPIRTVTADAADWFVQPLPGHRRRADAGDDARARARRAGRRRVGRRAHRGFDELVEHVRTGRRSARRRSPVSTPARSSGWPGPTAPPARRRSAR